MKKKSAYLFAINEEKIPSIIEGHVKKTDSIIYGRRAMNKQLPGFVRATTYDYDIYNKTPKKTARQMQGRLDKEFGADMFYDKPAQHPGTHKVMFVGKDMKKKTEDDQEIADYTQMPSKVQTKRIGGIRYESIRSVVRGKKAILRDKESAYRHEKDREDLRRIKVRRLFGGT